jgi:hypothetical protein
MLSSLSRKGPAGRMWHADGPVPRCGLAARPECLTARRAAGLPGQVGLCVRCWGANGGTISLRGPHRRSMSQENACWHASA